jgi:predicted transcriptional regulator of viral defense system/very-short-patch-repair endonuclease
MSDFSAAYEAKRSPNTVGIRIEELATRQHGVVSRGQLLGLGLSPNGITRRHARRDLVRLHQGVYAVGHRRLTSQARELAAVLACGPGAVLSHRTAASRHGLLRSASARIQVSVPRGRRSRKGIVVHRPRVLDDEDSEIVEGIPITSVARTIVDLSADPEAGRMLNAAERARSLDIAAIERTLARLPRQPGRRRLLRLLASYRPEPAFTRSEAERRFLALCRHHGLPAPQANLWIEGYEIDFFWADAALAVEIDGSAFHRGTRAFHEDRRRDRALLAAGIHTARVTWDDLRTPACLAAQLQAIRARR